MKKNTKTLLFWIIFFGISILFYSTITGTGGVIGANKKGISDFHESLEEGRIVKALVTPIAVVYYGSDGEKNIAEITPYYSNNVIEKLVEKNIKTEVLLTGSQSKISRFIGRILDWLPTLIFVAIWIYFMKKSTGGTSGPGKLFGFSKSKAKMIKPENIKVRFVDVAGIDEAKEELVEIVDFLRDPKKYRRIGGKIPKGCLLFGSPGSGKTLLAKAIAGESKVPFFSVSGSDFVEMFVGVGASRVRELFADAKANSPCIIFIDEIDAVGRHRGSGVGGGNDEREQTLNQLLVEMDGFEENTNIIVIAATNRPDVLDKALTRPGRFDRQIVIPLPDILGRAKILNVHSKHMKLAPSVNLDSIAKSTPGFTGAQLANLCNEAALIAAREGYSIVIPEHFESAKDKILMGIERKSMVMKDEERKLTAYHEAGHAIVALHAIGSDPIHKATIIPRGRALGVVFRYPEDDRYSYTREKMYADLAVAMGGRVAEEMIFGYNKVTSGASSDIKQATTLAAAMVKEWGMSDLVGPIYHGQDNPYYKEMPSEEVNKIVDKELRKLVEDASSKAREILTEYNDQLEKLAQALLKYETLTGSEIKELIFHDVAPQKIDASLPDEDLESSSSDKSNGSLYERIVKKLDTSKTV